MLARALPSRSSVPRSVPGPRKVCDAAPIEESSYRVDMKSQPEFYDAVGRLRALVPLLINLKHLLCNYAVLTVSMAYARSIL